MPEVHKEGQGVLVRRTAFWALAILVVWGGQSLYTWLYNKADWAKALILEKGEPRDGYLIPVFDQRFNVAFLASWGFVVVALTLVWKLLNKPKSADFLIDTESELKKVTWPSWKDAMNSSLIVILFVCVLTGFLLVSDWGLSSLIELVLPGS